MPNSLHNIFDIFFPNTCVICENQLINAEDLVCITCRSDLPFAKFSSWENNKVETSFQGRVPIKNATSLLYFKRKGKVQKLIHQLKYKNRQEIGVLLANWLSIDMIESKRFGKIDFIVPVPIHKLKLKKRGYNQVTTFGKTLAKLLDSEFLESALVSVSKTKTQTFKTRFERSTNVQEKFELINKDILKNKHILLIDDIITTGATLEACSIKLLEVENIKISIATMAYTV